MSLVLTGNNLVATDSSNSRYKFNFIGNTTFDSTYEITLSSLNIYYSWQNINMSVYGNGGSTSLSYTWVDGTVVPVVIPDGNYCAEDIQNLVYSVMQINGHYLLNASGSPVFYVNILTNAVLYKIEIDVVPVPTVLPSGWTIVAGTSPTWTLNGHAPQLNILSQKFGNLLGFNVASYPASAGTTTVQSFLSTFVGTIAPVSSVLVNCSLVYNEYSPFSNTLYAFAIGNEIYAQNITRQPPEFVWQQIKPGNYSSFEISFTDQYGNRLQILDPDLTVVVNIRKNQKGFSDSSLLRGPM